MLDAPSKRPTPSGPRNSVQSRAPACNPQTKTPAIKKVYRNIFISPTCPVIRITKTSQLKLPATNEWKATNLFNRYYLLLFINSLQLDLHKYRTLFPSSIISECTPWASNPGYNIIHRQTRTRLALCRRPSDRNQAHGCNIFSPAHDFTNSLLFDPANPTGSQSKLRGL